MGGQPARAAADELVDLGLVDPVVLVIVEHGQQDVEVVEQIGHALGSVQAQREVPTGPPVGVLGIERDGLGRDLVAERREQPPDDVLPAAGGDGGQRGLERDRRRRELRPLPARAGHRALEHGDQRDREKRGGDVRPVVDVLGEREPPRPPPAAHEPDGVDVEHERRGAPLLARLGIEHVRGPERHGERLHPVGVQEAEVGRRPVGRRERQEHGPATLFEGVEEAGEGLAPLGPCVQEMLVRRAIRRWCRLAITGLCAGLDRGSRAPGSAPRSGCQQTLRGCHPAGSSGQPAQ